MGPPSKAIPQYLKRRGDLLSKEDTVYSLSKMLLIQTKDRYSKNLSSRTEAGLMNIIPSVG